uniref:Uncharacterized protein n=1 Tax=Otolemur garnettii TaxID=30611 RepID=H0XVV9_OTOGA
RRCRTPAPRYRERLLLRSLSRDRDLSRRLRSLSRDVDRDRLRSK